MVNIRAARLEEISKISSVIAASWKTAYRGIVNDDYLNSLRSDHWVDFLDSGLGNNSVFSMVIENNQEVIGTAILKETENKCEVCLISLYLLPNKIGQGFGHIFYTGVETELKNKGFSNCILDVLENNKRAIRFYKAHGFIDSGIEIKAVLGECNYTCTILEKTL